MLQQGWSAQPNLKSEYKPAVSWTHPLYSFYVACWCVATKHSPSNHDESIRNWMTQMRIFKAKTCGVGSVEGWVSPPKPFLCRVPGPQDQTGILNQKWGGGMHEWGWAWNSYCTLSTLHPNPPKHLYWREHSWKHILFSLVLRSWSMPESQGQVILQKSWNSAQWPWSNWAGRTQQHLLWLARLLPDLYQDVSVCYLQTYVAASCSQRFSVSPLTWVWSGWKETGRKNEVSWHETLSGLGNQGLHIYSSISMFYDPLIIFLMGSWCLQERV